MIKVFRCSHMFLGARKIGQVLASRKLAWIEQSARKGPKRVQRGKILMFPALAEAAPCKVYRRALDCSPVSVCRVCLRQGGSARLPGTAAKLELIDVNKTDAKQAAQAKAGQGAQAQSKASAQARRTLRRNWYDGQNREIVVYYLIAVAFLELIVGAVAFFYGVVHAEPMGPDGVRMASFPWVGWLIAAILSPVGLLLILHLSGQYFSRSLNATSADGMAGGADAGEEVPERVQRLYAIVKHAPTVVVLLGLIALGGALFFLDSAMDVLISMGRGILPYLPWILGSLTVFLIVCYIVRQIFVARHNRMQQEYAYRLKVLEKTGIIIASKGSEPLKLEDGRIVPIESGRPQAALPPSPEGGDAKADGVLAAGDAEDVSDAEIVEEPSPAK